MLMVLNRLVHSDCLDWPTPSYQFRPFGPALIYCDRGRAVGLTVWSRASIHYDDRLGGCNSFVDMVDSSTWAFLVFLWEWAMTD